LKFELVHLLSRRQCPIKIMHKVDVSATYPHLRFSTKGKGLGLMKSIRRIGQEKFEEDAVPVIALAHNEANIMNDFLAHYRSLGPVNFLIVDDRSTDDTTKILLNAPDVTVFQPVDGSNYYRDKATWRSELLDHFSNERWCLVPDIDEHFIFVGANSLLEYISQVECEGAEAVATLMIDMYADLPLRDHLYPGGTSQPLSSCFNYFDGPTSYVMRRITGRKKIKFPTPPIAFHGGPRHRILHGEILADSDWITRWILQGRLGLDQSVQGNQRLFRQLIIDRKAKDYFSGSLNMTKLGLLRWRQGMRFNGGAHKLNEALAVSESIAGFLHYPFTRGAAGIEYISNRRQHADGAKHYRALAKDDLLDQSPIYANSKRYESKSDLKGLIRPVPI